MVKNELHLFREPIRDLPLFIQIIYVNMISLKI